MLVDAGVTPLSLAARNAAMLGDEAVIAARQVADELRQAMPLDVEPVRSELQALLSSPRPLRHGHATSA